MADPFKYISPREFQRLSAADKKRYLAELFDNLHNTRKPLQEAAVAAPERKRRTAKASKT